MRQSDLSASRRYPDTVVGSLAALSPPVRARLGPVRTERLDLRAFRPDDLDVLAEVFSSEAVWRYPFGRGRTLEETADFITRQIEHWDELGFGLWLAVERETERSVGYLGLSVPTFLAEILPAVEVGWRLHPSVWGRGYATEGATAALDHAFATLGLEQVCSLPQAENHASIRVAERLGMHLERKVNIPGTERRGCLEALKFVVSADEWRLRRTGQEAP
ncbi:MAG: acetyltransferase [Acidimicrobiaceae bacterium]|nr:acetyltransferase [Acidimicrobiaceae bacterium]